MIKVVAILCAMLLLPGDLLVLAQSPQGTSQPAEQRFAPEQLQSLLAPIALYPDALLAQILAASTYPLQVVEAARWLKQHSSLQGQALVDAAAKQQWDPSVQALVVFKSVLAMMDQDLSWTTALGNAFLAQQEDVMAAVQYLRRKAYDAKALQSNSQQVVEVQSPQVIVIQPANPQTIYIPSYSPTVIYGPPPVAYPYPVLAYPAYPTGAVVAASAISFGIGVAVGAAFRGCCGGPGWGWGWGCNWGGRSVTINNTFINRYGLRPTPYTGAGVGAWAHNPAYRGAVAYPNAGVAGRYSGAVATPYGSAAGVRGPNGAAAVAKGPNATRGAVATPNGSASAVRTPYGSAATATGRNSAAAGIRTPNGAAGAVSTPRGDAAGVKTPYGSAVNTPSGTYTSPNTGSADRMRTTPQPQNRPSASTGEAGRSAFGGGGSGSWARSSDARGASSMQGRGGGGGAARGGRR